MYVALTRSAGGHLIIMHDNRNPIDYLQHVDPDCINIQYLSSIRERKQNNKTKRIRPAINIQSLLSFVDTKVYQDVITHYLHVKVVQKSRIIIPDLQFSPFIHFEHGVEDITPIIQIMLPLTVEYKTTGQCKQVDWILNPVMAANALERNTLMSLYGHQVVDESHYNQYFTIDFLREIQEAYTNPNTHAKWLKLANGILAFKNYTHLLNQVSNYDWFHQCNINSDDMLQFVNAQNSISHTTSTWFTKCVYMTNDIIVSDHIHVSTNNKKTIIYWVMLPTITSEDIVRVAIQLAITSTYTSAYIYNMTTQEIQQVTLRTQQEKTDLVEHFIQLYRQKINPSTTDTTMCDSEFLEHITSNHQSFPPIDQHN
jgi:hypothetical protein